jgi:hypothetical protein
VRREREIIRKAGIRDQGSENTGGWRLVRKVSRRPYGTARGFWGVQTPGCASLHPGLFSPAPSGRCLRRGWERFAHEVRGFPPFAKYAKDGAPGTRLLSPAPPGSHLRHLRWGWRSSAERTSRMGFVASQAPEAGPGAPSLWRVEVLRLGPPGFSVVSFAQL